MSEPITRPSNDDAGPPPGVRPDIEAMPTSPIRDISVFGRSVPGVIPLWFGESDIPTPPFIIDAGKRALDAGDTFYTANLGIEPLRAAIAEYVGALYGIALNVDRVGVTASGMSGIMLVMETVIEPGDNVVVTSPVWPNMFRTIEVMRGEARLCPLDLTEDGWRLDLERLFGLTDDRTRALVINSPSNPTGWMMPADQQRAVIEFCRRRGIWIVADEVYDRIVYDRQHAPSFLQAAEPEDRVIAINSFSKSWCMTGWRLGWLVAPAPLMQQFEKLIEFNWSCAPGFVQQAGVAAIREGEAFIAESVETYRRNRDIVFQRLSGLERVRLALPEAAFYAFPAVDGLTDSVSFARALITRHKVGVAPGVAFGPDNEAHLRLCFAASTEKLSQALDGLVEALR